MYDCVIVKQDIRWQVTFQTAYKQRTSSGRHGEPEQAWSLINYPEEILCNRWLQGRCQWSTTYTQLQDVCALLLIINTDTSPLLLPACKQIRVHTA